MIIDIHQHAHWLGYNDAGLIADMDSQGIDYAWLLTWEIAPEEFRDRWLDNFNPAHVRPDGTHPGLTLEDVLSARDRYASRFVAGYAPHPAKGDAAALFEAAVQTHSVRICGECKFRMLLDDPRCLELFKKAGELACPVLFHMTPPYLPDGQGGKRYNTEWFGGTVDNLEQAMQVCPETVFIGHAEGFWREISGTAGTEPSTKPTCPVNPGGRLISLFEQYANLYGDLSAKSGRNALNRDPGFAKDFLIRFADRLLFGRDETGNKLRAFLDGLDLPEETQRKIYYENAKRLVPL